MSLSHTLSTLRTQIAAAERRATDRAAAVTARLRAGEESGEAERALFAELDGLALLRQRLCAVEGMQRAAQSDLLAAA